MKTITVSITIPADLALSFADSVEEFGRQLRLAAAIHWYDRGLISQGKGAEIAGLNRAQFIDALNRANVSAIQTTIEDLRIERDQADACR